MLNKIIRLDVLIVVAFTIIASIISFGLLGGFNYYTEVETKIELTATPIVFVTATSVPKLINKIGGTEDSYSVANDLETMFIDILTKNNTQCYHLRLDNIVINKINCDK